MQKNNLTQKNYTSFGNIYQLKLPLNIECKAAPFEETLEEAEKASGRRKYTLRSWHRQKKVSAAKETGTVG